MATEVTKKEETKTEKKGLLQIAEVRMLLYVIPVALVVLVIALVVRAL
jgi:hypothetical protein